MDLENMVKPSLLQRQKRRDKRLHEEVIEVGRGHGGHKNKDFREQGYKKFYVDNFTEAFPKNIPIAPLGRSTHFDDNLGCLKKYLMSHVGQRWDAVFSKLNGILDARTVSGQHIIDHVWGYVERDVEIVEGKVVNKRYRRFFGQKDCPNHYSYFYVHPETGILSRWCPPKKEACPKKARYKTAKEKRKYQLRAEQKTDKTPPKVVEKRIDTEGVRKPQAEVFYSAHYDKGFKKALEDEFFGEHTLSWEACKNQKPKTSKERFRLLFYIHYNFVLLPHA